MTEVKNLTNFAIQSTSDTEDVQTYDHDSSSSGGWAASVVTGNSYTVDCTLNIDMLDAGYLILKKAALESATGTAIEWFRESHLSPLVIATPACLSALLETHAGVAYVTNFSEDIQAGNGGCCDLHDGYRRLRLDEGFYLLRKRAT